MAPQHLESTAYPTDTPTLSDLAERLDTAAAQAVAMAQVSHLRMLSVEQAYDVQRLSIERRYGRGERLVGWKMGFTSRAKMEQMGVDELIWGRLTDAMAIENNGTLRLSGYVHPRIEPEICFRLRTPLQGQVDAASALAAVDAIAPALEIIDSRYENFKFSLPDVIADNSSSSGFVIGPWRDAGGLDLAALEMALMVDDSPIESGKGSAILDHPINALIAAARLIPPHDGALQPGMIVMAGAATAAWPLKPGVTVAADVESLGRASVSVVA